MLTYLLRSLKSFKVKKEKKTIKGFTFPLFIFFLIRIPALARHVLKDPELESILDHPNLEFNFPLILGLSKVLQKSLRDGKNSKIGNLLSNPEVDWQPYIRLSLNFVPPEFRRQLLLRSSRTCLICYEKVIHHRPDLGFRQLGMGDGDIDITMLPVLPVLKLKQRVGHSNISWETRDLYKPYIDRWRSRWHQCFLEELRSISELSSGTGNRPGICACPADTSIAMHATAATRGIEEEYLFDETECDIGAVSDFLLRLLMMKKLVRIQTGKHEFLHVHPDQQDEAATAAVVVVAVASPHPQLVDLMAASRRSATMHTKYLKPAWLLLP
ncbi:hypothetical protein Q3G72_010513 [Acer saccharum]|nr:hypothetical protein Q3G72_010513 [Acer saccharum]